MGNAIIASADWSPQQQEALEQIGDWRANFDGSRPYFYLAGYAGTGKTTLLKQVAQHVDRIVVFGSLTGKAASVMRQKGCDDAQTFDKLVYKRPAFHQCLIGCEERPLPCKNPCRHARVRFLPKRFNPTGPIGDSALTCGDEVSMVNDQLGTDILSYGKPIFVTGDPGQLPPPAGCGFFTNRNPDFLLTEVHRQAANNPIINLATAARNGQRLEFGCYGSSAVLREIDPIRMLDFDQIIVGTHQRRRQVNAQYRKMLGHENQLPMVGERLLCLRNARDNRPLYNGTPWTVLASDGEVDDGFIDLTIADDDGQRLNIKAPIDVLLSDDVDRDGAEHPGDPFTWGYSLTAHKAQGSEWGSVLIYDESYCFRTDRYRWLYTAITRAIDTVVVVDR